MTITKDTPIAMLTVGQLQDILGLSSEQKPHSVSDKPKKYVYGLAGIKALFNVSHATAQRYKNTFLHEAISQQGKIIVTDVEKAMELFKKWKG